VKRKKASHQINDYAHRGGSTQDTGRGGAPNVSKGWGTRTQGKRESLRGYLEWQHPSHCVKEEKLSNG